MTALSIEAQEAAYVAKYGEQHRRWIRPALEAAHQSIKECNLSDFDFDVYMQDMRKHVAEP